MKKVYQEIMMSFYIEDEKDIDEVLFEMSVDFKDNTGKIDDVDWEYRHQFVED
tara:strand:+ start:1244 stop:1402 length:159 start_codon:yes stop_codon:yes gene_type:complete